MKARRAVCVISLGLWLPATAAQFVPFSWVNPLPQGNDLNDVTYAKGIFVAVGDFGTVITSSNGIDWQLQKTPTLHPLDLICEGNGVFVAAGPSGSILTSSDGANWAAQTPFTTNAFTAITFGNSIFVLADAAGNTYTSAGGTNWSAWEMGAGTNAITITSIAYGNGEFVGAAGSGWVVSRDGAHWSFTAAPENFSEVIEALFASGSFFLSASVVTMTGDEQYSNPAALQSTDGTNWTGAEINNGRDFGEFVILAFGNGQFSGMFTGLLVPVNSFFVSSDFINWTNAGVGMPSQPYAINAETFGGGLFVCVGALGTIMTSSNLQSWSSASPWFGQTNISYALASASNTVVAVGNNYSGPYGSALPVAYVSTNGGLSWNEDVLDTNGAQMILNAVSWGNGTYVAVGGAYSYYEETGGVILTSTNGVEWQSRNPGVKAGLANVTFANGGFVCVGASGTILTSPTGDAWTGLRSIGDSERGHIWRRTVYHRRRQRNDTFLT
jgi:hypothetical protein